MRLLDLDFVVIDVRQLPDIPGIRTVYAADNGDYCYFWKPFCAELEVTTVPKDRRCAYSIGKILSLPPALLTVMLLKYPSV